MTSLGLRSRRPAVAVMLQSRRVWIHACFSFLFSGYGEMLGLPSTERREFKRRLTRKCLLLDVRFVLRGSQGKRASCIHCSVVDRRPGRKRPWWWCVGNGDRSGDAIRGGAGSPVVRTCAAVGARLDRGEGGQRGTASARSRTRARSQGIPERLK